MRSFSIQLLLLAGLLLAGDRTLRTLASTRVGAGALSADGQALAVPDTGVAADLDLASDVRGDLGRRSPSTLKLASM
jgi:hypothetical protein